MNRGDLVGTWSATFDGSDGAADWFSAALAGADIDTAIDAAFKYDDTFDQARAAAYLLTVLGRSSYVWPGDLDRLEGHVRTAAARLEAMLDPEADAGSELIALWGSAEAEVFDEIRKELAGLRAAHARHFA